MDKSNRTYQLVIPNEIMDKLNSLPNNEGIQIMTKLGQAAVSCGRVGIRKIDHPGANKLWRVRGKRWRLIVRVNRHEGTIESLLLGHRDSIYQDAINCGLIER